MRYAKASSMHQSLRTAVYVIVVGFSISVAWLSLIGSPRPAFAAEPSRGVVTLASNAIEAPSAADFAFSQSVWDTRRAAFVAAIATVVSLISIVTLFGICILQRDRRARTERTLSASRNTMSFVEAATSSGLWRMDAENRPIRMTHDCRTLLNLWDAPQVITLDVLSSAVHADDRAAFVRDFRCCARFGQPLHSEFRVVLDENQIRWIAVRGRRCDRAGAERGGIEGIFIDITAMREMEQEVDAQREDVRHLMRQAVMNELSGSIAHELNQPLTAILSNAEAAQDILRNEDIDRDKLQGIISDIVNEDVRASDVVNRVRRMLKKGHAKIESLDIVEVLKSTIALLRGELSSRKSSIELDASDILPHVEGDAVQLQQVFVNLIVNALDAMANTPTSMRIVRINVSMSDDEVRICFADQGHGILTTVEARLFEQFVTTKDRGLGLGLWICRAILTAHGGGIEIANNDGPGATVTVSLRRRQTAASKQVHMIMEAAE
jgi:C4-dicarboxylate-specific signal transduction histidine kinase